MTIQSLAWALATSLLVAMIVGWVGRRYALPRQVCAAWAIAVGFTMGLAVLSAGISFDVRRVIAPREALDWLSSLSLSLAMIQCLELRSKFSKIGWCLGIFVCVAAAFRLLAGSVYLRPGSFNWQSVAGIGLWGLAVAASWASMARSLLKKEDQDCRMPVWQVVSYGVLLAAIAVVLGMSGSFKYGAVGGLVALATLGTVISTGRLTAIASALAMCMIGLSVAFSELTLPISLGMGISLLAFSLAMQVVDKSARRSIMALSVVLMLVSSGLVALHFVNQLSAKPDSNGYEAYR